jgi:hypothetical protein
LGDFFSRRGCFKNLKKNSVIYKGLSGNINIFIKFSKKNTQQVSTAACPLDLSTVWNIQFGQQPVSVLKNDAFKYVNIFFMPLTFTAP